MSHAEPPAAERWAAALDGWAIPAPILAAAPEPPWGFPASLFRAEAAAVDLARADRTARLSLGSGGTVVDVGCGGGAASLSLAPPAALIRGVDEQAGMLEAFAASCIAAGVVSEQIEGRWPDVAARVAPADVVVCHHVAYNVRDLAPFIVALDDHARAWVEVELTAGHPSVDLAGLWQRFWGIDRPDEPSADLFVEVVRDLGLRPHVRRARRPARQPGAGRSDYVAFVRRRLCLPADRDGEIATALGDDADGSGQREVVTVGWRPATAGSRLA